MSPDQYILAACNNPGGAAGMLPVVEELRNRSLSVKLLASGVAAKLANEANLEHSSCKSAAEAIIQFPNPSLFITSMCEDGGIGRDLVHALRDACRTVALQDYWGGGLFDTWNDLEFRPDHIVVNDQVGAEIVQQAWPEYDERKIQVLGYPAMDELAKLNKRQTATDVRQKLGLDDSPIVLCAGGLDGTAHFMHEAALAFDQAFVSKNIEPYFMPRLHPRMARDTPNEYQSINAALHQISSRRVIPFTDVCTTVELIAASSLVLAEFSTVLVNAASLQQSCIAVLYREAGMDRYQRSIPLDEFPLVKLGCCYKAINRNALAEQLRNSLWPVDRNHLQATQARCFQLDGKNASRVADFLQTLLN